MRAAPRRRHHGAIEPPIRQKNPRRVDQDDLGIVFDDDTADQRAGGLHLARDDGHLGTDQRVDQRRLADIGRADQRDETAARGSGRRASGILAHLTPSRAIIAEAASFSAARLLLPTPSAGASPGTSTAMRNTG